MVQYCHQMSSPHSTWPYHCHSDIFNI
jgi:hypothetical protein